MPSSGPIPGVERGAPHHAARALGGCTNVTHDVGAGVAVAGDDDAAAHAAAGQPPCYTPAGVPYYTPGDAPCA
jgi:hypothetical protein